MYDTTVQGVLQVHVTCVIMPTMNRFVNGSKLVTFPFKLFPNFPQNLICYYSYIIIIFLRFVVRIFIVSHKRQSHCYVSKLNGDFMDSL
jgi:hypothetical protein